MEQRKSNWLLPALALALAACGGGDSGTDPEPPQEAPVSAVIVGGANQSAPVKTQLPTVVSVMVGREKSTGALAARFYRGDASAASLALASDPVVTNLTPLPNTPVSFVVPDAACGRPLAGSATTDANGVAQERWELGTAARRCKMEVRAMNQTTGTAMARDSLFATALPGPAAVIGLMGAGTPSSPARTIAVGDSVAVAALVANITDAYSNFVQPTGLEWRVDAVCDLSGCSQPGVKSTTAYATLPGTGTFRLYVFKDAAVNFMWVKGE